jgi:hypothetical protein
MCNELKPGLTWDVTDVALAEALLRDLDLSRHALARPSMITRISTYRKQIRNAVLAEIQARIADFLADSTERL